MSTYATFWMLNLRLPSWNEAFCQHLRLYEHWTIAYLYNFNIQMVTGVEVIIENFFARGSLNVSSRPKAEGNFL